LSVSSVVQGTSFFLGFDIPVTPEDTPGNGESFPVEGGPVDVRFPPTVRCYPLFLSPSALPGYPASFCFFSLDGES